MTSNAPFERTPWWVLLVDLLWILALIPLEIAAGLGLVLGLLEHMVWPPIVGALVMAFSLFVMWQWSRPRGRLPFELTRSLLLCAPVLVLPAAVLFNWSLPGLPFETHLVIPANVAVFLSIFAVCFVMTLAVRLRRPTKPWFYSHYGHGTVESGGLSRV